MYFTSVSTRESVPQSPRTRAARAALELCARVDALAREVEVEVTSPSDDDRLFELLEQRDTLLTDLADQLVVLRHARPADDSIHFTHTERTLDEVESLIAEVMAAVSRSERETMALVAQLAGRADEIRAELGQLNRISSASAGYGSTGGRVAMPTPQAVDRIS
jgi:hypothetical protein